MGWSTSVIAGICITCVAALFMAIGFSIPFWMSVAFEDDITTGSEPQTFNVYVGVWYAMSCIKGEANSCKTGALEPEFGDGSSSLTIDTDSQTQGAFVTNTQMVLERTVWWWVLQIVTTVSLGFVLLATLILICCRCAGIHSKGFFIISGILLFFGGLLSLIISILVAIGIALFFDFVDGTDLTAETFPWSVLCFGLGGVLALIAAVIIMYVTCNWDRLGKYYESDTESAGGHEHQMSNLAKYDRPRKYESRSDDYSRGYDKKRDFSSSKKYRGENGYEYSSRDHPRDYEREYQRDHSRTNQGYDYNSYDRGYEQRSKYDYDYDKANNYSHSRPGETMYRPYDQYRY